MTGTGSDKAMQYFLPTLTARIPAAPAWAIRLHTKCRRHALCFFGRKPGEARAAILVATLCVALLPFWLANRNDPEHAWLSNKAEASTDATPDARAQYLQGMTERGRERYGRTVRETLFKKPDTILKLIGDDILLALAQPDLKRVDGAGQIWQYRSDSCVLDVFLQSGNVVHYEMRQREKAALLPREQKTPSPVQNKAACLKTMVGI
ncbi:MAG TPA: hypothetical protein VIG74_07345 [Alphaproteobacteria bacterium]